MTSFTKPTAKPRGWTGSSDASYWRKDTLRGVRRMCTDCGRETLGYARDDDRQHHWDDCQRIAGPRKEWRGYVDATGKACVHRLNVPDEQCHETREAALLALDAELAVQQEAITRQRAQVAAMLREPQDD
jgi:hypothetical protein